MLILCAGSIRRVLSWSGCNWRHYVERTPLHCCWSWCSCISCGHKIRKIVLQGWHDSAGPADLSLSFTTPIMPWTPSISQGIFLIAFISWNPVISSLCAWLLCCHVTSTKTVNAQLPGNVVMYLGGLRKQTWLTKFAWAWSSKFEETVEQHRR